MSYLKTIALLSLIVVLGACQPNNQNSTNPENTTKNEQTYEENKEKSIPLDNVKVSLSQNKQNITSESVLNCFPSNSCYEETVNRELGNVNLYKMTEDVSITSVKEDEEITINIDGPQPKKISYITETLKNDTASISDEVVDGNSFVISSKGEYSILLTAQWEDENGKFDGSVSKAAKLNVK
ncbi:hypothetical protein [Halobacillus sp. Cin3]|uniref:hypothetical protein n=1 Tax=Halobacillus sp. Cin3 TaxID=2928441 RepID=UPI00248F012D|nr:hypothetical protein [Halobacillus sp. Cin3]